MDDPAVKWIQPNRFGIAIDEKNDVWHSGRLTAVLRLDETTIVVGAASGGVWVIGMRPEDDGTYTVFDALPLSDDWGAPDISCLARGPDGDRHVYAGTRQGEIWETDTTAPAPLLTWRKVPQLPIQYRYIPDMVVLRELRRIVISDGDRLYWSPIPQPGGAYDWHDAQWEHFRPDAYKLAIGSTVKDQDVPESERASTIILGTETYGIYWGQWTLAGDLLMREATIFDAAGHPIPIVDANGHATFGPISVASWEPGRFRAFAACSATGGGPFKMVVGSTDGGETWHERGNKLENINDKDMATVAGFGSNAHRNCITISDWNADLIAIGWQHEAPFISYNGGMSWWVPSSPHLHADIDCVRFGEVAPSAGYINVRHQLFVAGDGGLAMITNLGPETGFPTISEFNRTLATLQFTGPVDGRITSSVSYANFPGTLNAANLLLSQTQPEGLTVGGLQDNGIVYSVFSANPDPWHHAFGGDGELALLTDRHLIHSVLGSSVQASQWQPGSQTFGPAVDIPISVAPPSEPALQWTNMHEPRCGNVPLAPGPKDNHGFALLAVAGVGQHVFGLYAKSATQWNWRWIATANRDVTAVASYDGTTVFFGAGGIFFVDLATRREQQWPVTLPAQGAARPPGVGQVLQIVLDSPTSAWAALDDSANEHGYVVRLQGGKGDSRSNGLPMRGSILGLAMDPGTDPVGLYAIFDAHAYVSPDNGMSWQRASAGLPELAHCSDIRFTRDHRGDYLYLSTWGRSVWVARLHAAEDTPTYPR